MDRMKMMLCRHIVKHMSYDAARQLLATVGQDHVIKVPKEM